ncbi:hypothetical protein SAMN04488573_1143 [Bacillus sp. 5mfcol3.1]|nr:hypothetical protein SAMN04488573_1143 [Bacillus sp. 5mfcol3.1]
MMILFIILNAMKIVINPIELTFLKHVIYFIYTYSDREKFLFEKNIGAWNMRYENEVK